MNHCFISYSNRDAENFGVELANELEGGHPYVEAWYDKRDIPPGSTWRDKVPDAINASKFLLFALTKDSVTDDSICGHELDLALRYKKPILILRLQTGVEPPFRLGEVQWIDFHENRKAGLAKLRLAVQRLDSPEGQLDALKARLSAASRDLSNAKTEEEKLRIQLDVDDLTKQVQIQQKIVDDPKGAEDQTKKNIEAGLERERQPEKPVSAKTSTKFINTPPGIAPAHFQDRYFETEQIAGFLNDDAQRLMTIVGRAGIGKTATTCRLLKDLERGVLPDDLGELQVDGIVYLSEAGSHKINFVNIFYDLCKLLPVEAAQKLDAIYKNPQGSTESKTHSLLDHFQDKPVVLLLDNFEPLVIEDSEKLLLRDTELDEALRALLNGTHTAVKIIITTRVPPKALNSVQPGRQRVYHLEAGLEPKYAAEMLRQMDKDGILGLKDADENLLSQAHERTRGFPKALEALFQILSSDRYTKLEELLAMPTPANVVEALVGEAFNRLDPSAQKVMQALAVYNRPVSPAAIDYLLQPHLPSIDSALVLNRLVNMHFARREAGRYYLHPADKEYAFSIIPEKDLTTKDTKVTKENQRKPSRSLRLGSAQALHALRLNAFTQHDLLNRAADYFAQARKPRAEWKKLDDLAAQLAEFELRCAAGDYDTAANVLLEIDRDSLIPWGHYRLMIDLYEKLREKIQDKTLSMFSVARLGGAYRAIGKIQESIKFQEQALFIAQEKKDRVNEGSWLNNLGAAYFDLGNMQKAIDYLEKALVIAGDTHYQEGEATRLMNIGEAQLSLNQFQKAEENYKQAIYISDEIQGSGEQQYARCGLSQTYLFQDDFVNARATIETALQYDVPENNHNATALHGIIALRQGERETAQEAFTKSIAQADEILAKTPDYYSALDAKGLSICGLTICDLPPSGTSRLKKDDLRSEAVETFRKARKIAPHAGVVKSVLRLFDELVKCDEEGVLKGVREVIKG